MRPHPQSEEGRRGLEWEGGQAGVSEMIPAEGTEQILQIHHHGDQLLLPFVLSWQLIH